MEPKMISKVLIVDDEPDTIELLQIVLAKNYKTMSAYCGREALNIARSEKPDIIILDIMMPDMTGYEVCKILKNDIETMSIPIILHSALSDSSDREIGMDSGADEYLTKPVDIENLKLTVSTLLDRKLNHNSALHEDKSGV